VPSRRPGVLDASRRRMHFYRRAASNRLIPHSIEVRMKPGQFLSDVLLALIGACSTSRSEEHTSELQSLCNLVCRLLLVKKRTERPPLRVHLWCSGYEFVVLLGPVRAFVALLLRAILALARYCLVVGALSVGD